MTLWRKGPCEDDDVIKTSNYTVAVWNRNCSGWGLYISDVYVSLILRRYEAEFDALFFPNLCFIRNVIRIGKKANSFAVEGLVYSLYVHLHLKFTHLYSFLWDMHYVNSKARLYCAWSSKADAIIWYQIILPLALKIDFSMGNPKRRMFKDEIQK